jgi:hypothetical protein
MPLWPRLGSFPLATKLTVVCYLLNPIEIEHESVFATIKRRRKEEEVYTLIECNVLSQAGKEIGYLLSVNYKFLFCHTPSARSDGPLFDLTE